MLFTNRNLEERYKALKNVVSKYALVAFGLSLFQNSGKSKDDPNCILYQNHSFNFLMLPQVITTTSINNTSNYIIMFIN